MIALYLSFDHLACLDNWNLYSMHFYLQIVYIVDNGLKDNILYEPADPDFDRKPESNGDEYAVVKEKGNTFHANDNGTIQETALHAEYKKKPKLGKKGNYH